MHKFNWKECASMADYNLITEKFKEADAILIAASNGLSISEGLNPFGMISHLKTCLGTSNKRTDYGASCRVWQGTGPRRKKMEFWGCLPPLLRRVPDNTVDGGFVDHRCGKALFY